VVQGRLQRRSTGDAATATALAAAARERCSRGRAPRAGPRPHRGGRHRRPAVQVYPIGLSFSLMLRIGDQPDARVGVHHTQYAFDPSSDEFVRLGVQFADGGKATNLRHPRPPSDQPPAGPLVTPHGGSGSAGAWDTYYWLWPLPPPGRLLIVAEWPAQHISETAVEVAADPILEAAAHAVTLWPEEDTHGGPAGYVRIDSGT
jgi:hypothetical protein